MSEITIETLIDAPREVCFDLMRDIRIHTQTTSQTQERAVDGVTEGLIGLGQTVTFEGRHFGLRQHLKVMVIEFDRPRRFVDAMVEGPFKEFFHVHEFDEVSGGGTLMRDTLVWESPFGPIGQVVDRLMLNGHLRRLVTHRNTLLKALAQSRLNETHSQADQPREQ